MAYWLFKSEPFKWSWEHAESQGREEGEEWDGIRNYQARNNMRAMKVGDKGFFYHSNEGLEVVGIIEVCSKEIHPDSTTDDRALGMRRHQGGLRHAQAGDAEGYESQSETVETMVARDNRRACPSSL
jgi:hypothetical protein